MKQTQTYQLNQWEPADRILMEDFNADNAKLDAALAEKLGRARIIKTMALPSASTFDLDLTDIDWNKWGLIGFSLDLLTMGSGTPSAVYCQVKTSGSGVTEYCSSAKNGYIVHSTYMPLFVGLLPLHDSSRRVESLYLGSSSGIGFAACTFADLTGLRVGGGFSASQTLTLWGIK